jgi:hypothetical protein
VVEVTRFGVFVIVTGDIANPNVGGEDRKLAAFTVIQQIDFHFIFWIINTLRSQDGIAHHLQRFVIAGNIDIDRRPLAHIIRQRNNFALQRPDRLQVVKQQHHPDIDFRQKQPHPQNRLNGGVKMQGLRQAKIHITGRHQQRRHDHNDRNAALLLNPIRKRIPMLSRPKIYCFWLSIGVITTSTATATAPAPATRKETFSFSSPAIS